MSAELTITVARTGGFAGLKREWSVSAALDDAADLIALVDACPWRSIHSDAVSRDRFVYLITVCAPHKCCSARLPESSLTGPWKTLVTRVQQGKPIIGTSGTTPRVM